MRKVLFIVMLFSLLAISISTVSAQEEAEVAVACTEEEVAVTTEALTAYSDGLSTLQEDYDLAVDPADPAYGATIIALDAVSYEFWNTVYPELPECAEAQALAFTLGSVYDEYLTIGLLDNIAAWTAANGDAEGAEVFSAQSAARTEALSENLAVLSEVSLTDLAAALSGESLEACTEEEIAALEEGLATTMPAVGDALAEMSAEPLLAFAMTEGASFAFENDVYDVVATCQENQAQAMFASISLYEVNLIMGLAANAVAEAEGGNAEVGQALLDSATQRLADFQASVAEASE